VTEWNATAYHKVSGAQTIWGQKVLARLELRGDERAIDAGCGSGRLTGELMDRLPNGTLIAIDRSWDMLITARANLRPTFGDRVRFARVALPAMPFSSWADLVFSTATFHWITDHRALFRNIFRTLRPGGRLHAQCGGGANLERAHVLAEQVMRDPPLAAMLPRVKRPLVTYGFDGGADLVGGDVELGAFGGRCSVDSRTAAGRQRLGTLELSVPGRHNLQNALAAVAVALQVGIDFPTVASALRDFRGAERRFERHGEAGGVLVVDDYGHHPTEIAAVIAAARATLGRRLIVVFQPHRYSRTRDLLAAFGPALAGADELLLTEIYAAGEEPVPGVTGELLAAAVREGSGRHVYFVRTLEEIIPAVLAVARPGDAVITLGAGSIGSIPARLLDALRTTGGNG
jgi:SAM-dependent methyltransferase